MAFSSINDPESITSICAAVASILGAIALLLKKVKGKSWKEIISSFSKEDFNNTKNTIESESKKIKKAINKN